MPSDKMEDFQRLKNTLGGGGKDSGKVTSLLAQARLQLDRNNFDKAKEYAEKVLKLSPSNQEAQELITRANRAEKDSKSGKQREDLHKEARTKAEEAKKKMEEAKEKAAQAEARKSEEEERLRLAEEDAIRRAEEARRLVEEAEEKRKEAERKRLEEEERLKAAMEEARRAEEEARHKAEEARRLAEEEEARRRKEEELRKKEEEERRRKAEEARNKAQEEVAARKKVEQITKFLAQARMRISGHKFDEARSFIEKALEIDQGSREVQAMIDRLEKAEEEYLKEEALRRQEEEEKERKEKVDMHLKEAEDLLGKNAFEEARGEVQEALSLDEANKAAKNFLKEIEKAEEEYKRTEKDRLEEEKRSKEIEEERKKAEEAARKRSIEDSRKRSEEEIQRKAEEARRIAAEELRKTAGIESRKVAKERRKKQEEEKKEVEPTLFPAEEIKKEEVPSSEDLAIAKEREEAFRIAREESLRAGEEEQKEREAEELKKEEEEKGVLQKWINAAEEHLAKDEFSQARGEAEKVLEADRKNREARVLLKRIVKAEKIKKKDEVRKQRREEAQRKAEEKMRMREEKEAQRMAEAEARAQAEGEKKKKEEEEARKREEQEEKRRLEEEKEREKALEEARKREEEEEKRRAEEEKERKKALEEEAKRQAEEDKKREKEEAKIRAEEEKKRLKEEEERKRLVEEARKKQEEEAKRQAIEEAKRRKAEEEARKKEEEERQKALEEARKKAEEETREKLKLLQDCLDSARVIVKEHKFDVAREEIQRALSVDPANREARRFMKEISRFERAYLKQQERLKREKEAKKREEEATRRRVEEEAKRRVLEEESLRKSQLVKGHLEVARESLAGKEFDKAREYTKKALDAELGNKDAKKFLREIDRYERMYHRKEAQLKRDEENIKRSEEERKRRQEQEAQRREQEENRRVQEEQRRIEEEKRRALEDEKKRELEEEKRRAEEQRKKEQEEARQKKEEEENRKKKLLSRYLTDARQCMGSHEFDLARQDVQKALDVDSASREARQLIKEIDKAEKVYSRQQERIKREEEKRKSREEEIRIKEEKKKGQLIEEEKRKKEEEKTGEAQGEEKKKEEALIKTVLDEAQQHIEGKRFEEARGSIQKALEIHAKSPEARNLLKVASREEKLHHKELKRKALEEKKREEGKPADRAVWLSKAKDKVGKVFESTLAGGKKEAQEDLLKASEEKEKPEVKEKKNIIPVIGLKYLSKGKEFITEGGWKKIDLAKIKKNYIWIILGILITTFILAHTIGKMKQVFFKGKETEKEGTQFMESIPVKVYKVKRMDFKDTLPVLGRIEGFKEIELRFGEGGILESFNFEEGERILEGDIIASLDQKDALLKLKYASIEMEKASRLLEIGGIDKAAADQKKLEYESAKRDLEKTNIYAASDGYLGSKETHTGAYVTPQDKIGVFVDFSEVYAAFDVIEEDSPKIELGQNAEIFLDAYPGATYKGTVDMVAPMIEGRTRTQKVKIELANENDELRPGMFARAIINTYEKQDALIIPASAFKKIENKYYVYVVHLEEGEAEELVEEEGEAVDPGVAGEETGTVEQREIKIVYLTHDVAEVGKGLEEGELVIREIHQEFKDKDKVEITEVQETIF